MFFTFFLSYVLHRGILMLHVYLMMCASTTWKQNWLIAEISLQHKNSNIEITIVGGIFVAVLIALQQELSKILTTFNISESK